MGTQRARGFTLIEMLVVLVVLGILLAILGLNLRPLYRPLNDATNRIEGFLKQARAKAMANTSAYRVRYQSGQHRLVAERAKHCGDTAWTVDPQLALDLPPSVGLHLSDILCFTSRGYATRPVTLTLTGEHGETRTLAVLLGGAVRRP